jgi:hypothetical protein
MQILSEPNVHVANAIPLLLLLPLLLSYRSSRARSSRKMAEVASRPRQTSRCALLTGKRRLL